MPVRPRPASTATSACPPSCAIVTTPRATRHDAVHPTTRRARTAAASTSGRSRPVATRHGVQHVVESGHGSSLPMPAWLPSTRDPRARRRHRPAAGPPAGRRRPGDARDTRGGGGPVGVGGAGAGAPARVAGGHHGVCGGGRPRGAGAAAGGLRRDHPAGPGPARRRAPAPERARRDRGLLLGRRGGALPAARPRRLAACARRRAAGDPCAGERRHPHDHRAADVLRAPATSGRITQLRPDRTSSGRCSNPPDYYRTIRR